jgi:uncharacterized coiled-coil DUF342 family protein
MRAPHLLIALALLLLPGCGLNRTEYEKMRALRDEYLSQLAEIRQSNETVNRNIVSAYQELDVLQTRLAERRAQARERAAQAAAAAQAQ